jgi:hypothetical protein
MPIHYGSQIDEHHAVRKDAGMFDVSHMCALDLAGPDATRWLRHLLANGFYCRYLVSAGVPVPPLYAKLGYQPAEVIKSDGVVRGVYTGIDNVDHIVSLVCDLPKASRYIMLTKK